MEYKSKDGKKENAIKLLDETVINKIYFIRNKRVMLDNELAELYQVETKVLNQAVKRNMHRFPPDFMFQLTEKEFLYLRSQIVTSSWDGLEKYDSDTYLLTPIYVFKEI